MISPGSQNSQKPKSWLRILALAVLLPVFTAGLIKDVWFDSTPTPSPKLIYGCKPKDWECIDANPPPMPDWNIPTDPQEKAAYDFAHSLPTPSFAPVPVPFSFRSARIVELEGGKHVAQQYFEHLCRTEAGEYISRTAEDVNGFMLLRPRGNVEFTPANSDRYGPEEPTGFGWFSDHDQFETKLDLLGGAYVQPLYGVYRFVEYVKPGDPSKVIRVERSEAGDTKRYPNGVESNWGTHTSGSIRAPYLVSRIEDTEIRSRYAYTWRGLRRDRDREFGIAGGEFLIVDRETNDVLGMKRTFNSTYVPRKPAFTNWFAARECGQVTPRVPPPLPYFIIQVLRPDLHVNDAFVPPDELEKYHQDLLAKMGIRPAQ